jgi:hypothetical protein
MFDGACIARETGPEYGLTREPEWQRAHRALTRLAKARAAHDFEEARWIVAASRAKTHKMLGFASFSEYLGRLFGWSPRLIQEKVRVAEALDALPLIGQALMDGALNWSAVRELTRVATPATEGDWLDATGGHSVREIERLVAGRRLGDRPNDRARPEVEKHVIHAEVSPETFALWREAMMAMQKQANGGLTEDETIRMIARAVLGGPADEGRAPYHIVITRCADCERVSQRGRGEEFDVAAPVIEAAECDAQTIDLRHSQKPPSATPRASQEIPPSVRRLVVHRDHGRCVVPGCRHAAFVDVHHLDLRSEGGTHDPDRLVTICSAHHQRAHEGRLLIGGTVSTGLTFRHADGSFYGGTLAPHIAAIMTDTFDALLKLGFKQGESGRALDEVRAHAGAGGAIDTVQAALKLALRSLTAGRTAVHE